MEQENFVGDGSSLGLGFLGIGKFQVAHRGAAQAGHCEIEQSYIEARKPEWGVGQRPQRRIAASRSFNPPTTQHQIAIVEDGGLAGRHGALRLVETDLDAGRVSGRR